MQWEDMSDLSDISFLNKKDRAGVLVACVLEKNYKRELQVVNRHNAKKEISEGLV